MVTCIVQARMGSERLPGKVLRKVLGIPLILLNLKRLEKSREIDRMILATSDRQLDDPLYETVKGEGFEVFRGDEENVLKRYRDCVLEYGGDIVVRVTGDCPLIDPDIADNVISHYKMYDYDYVRLDVPDTFVRGFDTEVFSREALFKAFDLADEYRYKEHVTAYMYLHPELFRTGLVRGESLFKKNYRLCVDTLEDFTLVEKIYEHFGDIYVSAGDVVKFLDNNPDIAAINSEVVQKHV
ncbi:MAG TPA: glycosyltransferase family protein [Bacillota bacterium]|nr:glycosyltransferase family protein [Clostridiaceae bacterium]HNR03592.1 glycosyltransferase family protein [Bacillota bacterium]HNT02580.1 glycosyltransferase family protein [Bacillota bacterium]HOH89073.1 glycosyltransferase family protein [Bacillota bacterium]HPA54431.1 glycosyltransferase family protein [Bacillota bacterium]